MTPITLRLIKKPAIYGMILLFSRLPLVDLGSAGIWIISRFQRGLSVSHRICSPMSTEMYNSHTHTKPHLLSGIPLRKMTLPQFAFTQGNPVTYAA